MAKRKLNDYDEISLKAGNLCGFVDFERIFGRSAGVHIEIGSGKGTFLVSQGQSRGEINFLGIEWAGKYYRSAVDRIGRWGLGNVRIIRTDAADFLIQHVGDSSVDRFHIYFPDPWPKKRHHKRRLFVPANLEQLLRCLKPGGAIKVVTDHADYFEQIKMVLAAQGSRLEEVDFLPTAGADEGEWVGTNFEKKYLKEQKAIYTVAVRKV